MADTFDLNTLIQQQQQAIQSSQENKKTFTDMLIDRNAATEEAKRAATPLLDEGTKRAMQLLQPQSDGIPVDPDLVTRNFSQVKESARNYMSPYEDREQQALDNLIKLLGLENTQKQQVIDNQLAGVKYDENGQPIIEPGSTMDAATKKKMIDANALALETGQKIPYPELMDEDPLLGRDIENISIEEIKTMAGSDAQAILKRMFGNGIDKALGGQQAAKNKTAKDILIRMKNGEDISSIMQFTGSVGTAISENQTLYEQVTELKQLMDDLNGSATGIGDVTMGNIALAFNKADPKYAEFQTKLKNTRNFLLKQMSGAAISPEEAKRLNAMLPGGIFDSDQRALANIDQMLDRVITNTNSILNTQGVEFDAEKYFQYGSGTKGLKSDKGTSGWDSIKAKLEAAGTSPEEIAEYKKLKGY